MKKTKQYLSALGNDIPSSIVVFLVALPLCLGVALASKAPLFSGLIAGVVGGIVVGLASKSHLSVSGPAAGLTSIVATAVVTLPSFEAFLVAVVLCGILQLILGFAKAGVIGDFVPNSVIKGMLAAIGLILILNQTPHLLGDDSQFEMDESVQQQGKSSIFLNFITAFGNISLIPFLIGAGCLALHFFWDRFTANKKGFIRLVPAPLLVVIIGITVHLLILQFHPAEALQRSHLVSIPVANTTSEFFSFFTFPDWKYITHTGVLTTALIMALVASLESLLSIEAVDDLDPYQRVTPTNRELKAQGLGNVVAGFIGGLPVTSVIVRSSANVNAGAKTKMSTIYHGAFLLLSVAFIPSLLNLIPKAALAAILIYTGYKLAKPSLFIYFYKKGWYQFLPFVITIAAILISDLLKGVIIGIVVGLIFVLRSNFKTAVFIVYDKKNYMFRLRKDVSFMNKALIKSKLESVAEDSDVLIDTTRADFIDGDVIETIEDYMLHAPLKNIRVELKTRPHIDQGFSKKILSMEPQLPSAIRNFEKEIVPTLPS